MNKLDIFNKTQQGNAGKFAFKVGDTVKVHQKVKDGDKDRIQIFEGLVIAKKHGNQPNGTFTVRKISFGIGVERVFPMHSPLIAKIEIVKSSKVRRSKLYFIRTAKGKKSKLKGRTVELIATEGGAIEPEKIEETTDEPMKETSESVEAK